MTEEIFVLAPSHVEESEQVTITQSQTPTASDDISSSRTAEAMHDTATTASYEVETEEFIVVVPTNESTSDIQVQESKKQVTFSERVEVTSSSQDNEVSSKEEENDDVNLAPVKLYRYLFW